MVTAFRLFVMILVSQEFLPSAPGQVCGCSSDSMDSSVEEALSRFLSRSLVQLAPLFHFIIPLISAHPFLHTFHSFSSPFSLHLPGCFSFLYLGSCMPLSRASRWLDTSSSSFRSSLSLRLQQFCTLSAHLTAQLRTTLFDFSSAKNLIPPMKSHKRISSFNSPTQNHLTLLLSRKGSDPTHEEPVKDLLKHFKVLQQTLHYKNISSTAMLAQKKDKRPGLEDVIAHMKLFSR